MAYTSYNASEQNLHFFLLVRPPPTSTLFPYTTLFRSRTPRRPSSRARPRRPLRDRRPSGRSPARRRSEEHTSELQSRPHLVCRLLLEKKKTLANAANKNHKWRSHSLLGA